jgi:N-carbamoyl-L-amino-acid hydrolase
MIDGERLRRDLEELAGIGRLPGGGISRPAFSPAEREARAWFVRKLGEAGLTVRVDEAGNISGRLPGRGPALLCGSHLDTVAGGGAFDGALGVLAALECARVIKERNLSCPSPLEVIAFSDEEESFLGFLGSRALVGRLSPREIAEARNPAGLTLSRALADSGLEAGKVPAARRDLSAIKAFVELHIEQGPILTEQGAAVGAVAAIMGNTRRGITLHGRRDHAGIPLKNRRDPLFGAVALIEKMRAHCRAVDPETLMTVGQFRADPGLENVIPAGVYFSIDLRHAEAAALTKLEQRLDAEIERLRKEQGLAIEMSPLMKIAPVRMSPQIRAAIREAAAGLGLDCPDLESGAGHDAQVLGQYVPTGMIFVSSAGGRSHCPEEHTDWQDIERGSELLLALLLRLAAADLPRPVPPPGGA